ncbi:MAG: sigma-70 family RNA polymerase sigma factor [Anaerolineae bacterium]
MKDAKTLRLLGVDRLADECADQTAKFFSRSNHDTGYCYELFRRAIVCRDDYAWDRIYQIYRPLVSSWVRRHPGSLEMADDEIDFFVNCAFEKMWSAMDTEKFRRSEGLAGLLRYLQTCVHSVIIDHRRGNPIQAMPLEGATDLLPADSTSVEEHVTDRLESDHLWQIVISLTKNEKERSILRYSFLYNQKPSEIYAANPGRFESLNEVYQIKRNLLNRLRRNPTLRQFLSS